MKSTLQIIVLNFFMLGSAIVSASPTNTKVIDHCQLMWYGYFNTIEWREKWFLTSELQERHFFSPLKQHQFLFRTHIHYKIQKGMDVSVGGTRFLQSPHNPYSSSKLIVPEWRPHLEFNLRNTFRYFAIVHRYRAEWRFFRNSDGNDLTNGHWNYFRFRYRLGIEIPLIEFEQKHHSIKLKISDEVHFNAGKNVGKNYFDQNRIYVGINYQFNSNLSMEFGYMNWYQQRPSGYEFYNRNIIRFTVFHKISLIKNT